MWWNHEWCHQPFIFRFCLVCEASSSVAWSTSRGHDLLPVCTIYFPWAQSTSCVHNLLPVCTIYFLCAWSTSRVFDLLPVWLIYFPCAWSTSCVHDLLPVCLIYFLCAWSTSRVLDLLPVCSIYFLFAWSTSRVLDLLPVCSIYFPCAWSTSRVLDLLPVCSICFPCAWSASRVLDLLPVCSIYFPCAWSTSRVLDLLPVSPLRPSRLRSAFVFPAPASPRLIASVVAATGKEDGKSCQKVTVRMTIRKNDCRSNRPVSSELFTKIQTAGGVRPIGSLCVAPPPVPTLWCAAGEHRVVWREVSVRQHLQLQHQHVRPLLQMLPRDGAAAALRAALLQRQRHLGGLRHPGAHRLLLPVVLDTHTHTHTHVSRDALGSLESGILSSDWPDCVSELFCCLCWQGGGTARHWRWPLTSDICYRVTHKRKRTSDVTTAWFLSMFFCLGECWFIRI